MDWCVWEWGIPFVHDWDRSSWSCCLFAKVSFVSTNSREPVRSGHGSDFKARWPVELTDWLPIFGTIPTQVFWALGPKFEPCLNDPVAFSIQKSISSTACFQNKESTVLRDIWAQQLWESQLLKLRAAEVQRTSSSTHCGPAMQIPALSKQRLLSILLIGNICQRQVPLGENPFVNSGFM